MRLSLIDPKHRVSVVRQCRLLGVPRSSVYYRSREPVQNAVLMQCMGLEALYCKPNTSKPHPEHHVYPYLLKGLAIVRPNQVWATDITYIRMPRGNAYLVAIMDWFSRYVVSWRLSTTMTVEFCLEALEEALSLATPLIFNSDQGSQFTSEVFTSRLLAAGAQISMDGRGSYHDNIFTERLWRSVKYEEVYLKEYASFKEAEAGISAYIRSYNSWRPHEALAYKTPEQVHFSLADVPPVGMWTTLHYVPRCPHPHRRNHHRR